MSYNVELNIFGTVTDPEAMWDLANSMAAESQHYPYGRVSTAQVGQMFQEAANDGRPVKFDGLDTKDLIDDVTTACQNAGLSYVLLYAVAGQEDFDGGYSWRPGMDDVFEFDMSDKKLVVSVAEVKKAANKGIAAVDALVEKLVSNTRVGRIEIELGFVEAYRDYAGDEAWPSTDAAMMPSL